MPLTRGDGSVICLPIGLLIYLDVMIKPIWKNILHILVTVLTALATTLGVSSCM
ncbi:smalltalk protein [uncultured Prevotella sp.]|uniref:smalltalk protein n=1 Tax=uncultured Prevotella sp. TaxID=159272 RepID=UPI0028039DA0|nr:smalltalk protein [uncultured Prevotella sp.]